MGRVLQHLDAEAQQAGTAIDLVPNGDAFELWQSRSIACKSGDNDQGCSSDEALSRVQQVIAAHRHDLEVLGQFALRGDNRGSSCPATTMRRCCFPRWPRR